MQQINSGILRFSYPSVYFGVLVGILGLPPIGGGRPRYTCLTEDTAK